MIFLMLKLLRFSSLTRSGITENRDQDLESGFRELNVYFKTSGIIITSMFAISMLISFSSLVIAGLSGWQKEEQ